VDSVRTSVCHGGAAVGVDRYRRSASGDGTPQAVIGFHRTEATLRLCEDRSAAGVVHVIGHHGDVRCAESTVWMRLRTDSLCAGGGNMSLGVTVDPVDNGSRPHWTQGLISRFDRGAHHNRKSTRLRPACCWARAALPKAGVGAGRMFL